MPSRPDLSFLDSRGREMTCPNDDSRCDRRMHNELQRQLATRVNKFFRETVRENVFGKHSARRGDLKIIDNRDGTIDLAFLGRGKRRYTYETIDRHDAYLFPEAKRILRIMRNIWGDHNDCRSDRIHRRDSRRVPHRDSRPRGTARSRTHDATRDQFALGNRIQKIRQKAIKLNSAALKVLEDFRKNRPIAGRAQQLIEKIDAHRAHLAKLCDKIRGNPAFAKDLAELEHLDYQLKTNKSRLQALLSNRKNLKNLQDIYRDFSQLAEHAFKPCPDDNQDATQAFIERFEAIVSNHKDLPYAKDHDTTKFVDRLRQDTYFFANKMHPEIQKTDEWRAREGEWLFTNLDSGFTNTERARCLQLALMNQLGSIAVTITPESYKDFKALFEYLHEKDQQGIVRKYAQLDYDAPGRRKRSDLEPRLKTYRRLFVGDQLEPPCRADRSQAIVHWLWHSLIDKSIGNRIRGLVQDNASLQDQLQALETIRSDLQGRLDAASSELREIRDQIQQAQASLRTLGTQKSAADRDARRLRAKVKDLEKAARGHKPRTEELRAAQKAAAASEQKAARLEQKLAKQLQELNKANQHRDILAQQLEQLRATHRLKDTELGALRDQVRQLQADAQKHGETAEALKQSEEQNTALSAQINQLKEKARGYKAARDKLGAQLREVQSQKGKADAEILRLQGQVKKLKAVEKALASKEQQFEAAKAAVVSIGTQTAFFEDQTKQQAKALKAADKKIKELSKQVKELEALKVKNKQKTAEIEELKKRIGALEKASEDHAAQAEELARYKKKARKLKAHIETLEKRIGLLAHVEEERDALARQVGQLQTELKGARKRIRELEERVRELEAARQPSDEDESLGSNKVHEDPQALLEQAYEERDAAIAALKKREGQYQKLKQKYTALKQQATDVRGAQAAFAELQQQKERVDAEVLDLRAKVAALSRKEAPDEDSPRNAAADNAEASEELQRELEEAREQLQQNDEELQTLRPQVQELTVRAEATEAERGDLADRLTALQTKKNTADDRVRALEAAAMRDAHLAPDLQQAREEANQLRLRVTELEQRLHHLQDVEVARADLAARFAHLQQEKETADRTVQQVQARLEEADGARERALKALADKEHEATELARQVEHFRDQARRSDEQNHKLAEELTQLRAEKGRVDDHARALEDQVHALETAAKGHEDIAAKLVVAERGVRERQTRIEHLEQETQRQREALEAVERARKALDPDLAERDRLRASDAQQKQRIVELQAETERLRAQIEPFEATKKALEEQSALAKRLGEQVEALTQRATKAEKQRDALATDLHQLREDKAAGDREVTALRQRVGALEAAAKGHEEVVRRLETAEREAGELREKIRTFEQQAKDHHTALSESERARAELVQQLAVLAELRKTNSSQERTIHTLREAVQKLEQAAKTHEETALALRAKEQEVTEATATIASLKTRLRDQASASKEKTEALSQELATARRQKDEALAQAAEIRKEAERLRGPAEGFVEATRKLQSAEAENGTLKSEIAELREASRAQVRALAASEETNKGLVARLQEFDALQAANAKKERRIHELEAQVAELQAASAELDEAHELIRMKEQETTRLETRISGLTADLHKKTQQHTQVEERLRAVYADLERYKALLAEEKRRYSADMLALKDQLKGKATEISALEAARQHQESALKHHEADLSAAQAKILELEEAIDDLRRQLFERAKADQIARQKLAVPHPSSPRPLSDRAEVDGKEKVQEVGPPLEIAIDDAAFAALSDDVKQGRIDMLLKKQNGVTIEKAPVALLTLLKTHPEEIDKIYFLAIFVANACKGAFRNSDLAISLQNWLMIRTSHPNLEDEEKHRLDLIIKTFSANGLEDLAKGTKKNLQRAKVMQEQLNGGRTGSAHERWIWATKMVDDSRSDETNPLKILFASRLKKALETAFGDTKILNPDKSSRAAEAPVMISPFELLMRTQGKHFTGRLTRDIHDATRPAYAYFTGGNYAKDFDPWKAVTADIEDRILQVIAECADLSRWGDVKELATLLIYVDPTTDASITLKPMSASNTLRDLEMIYRANPLKIMDNPDERLQTIESAITNRLCRLTGLSTSDPRISGKVIIEQALDSALPVVIDDVLKQEDGKEAQILARLVYWHSAIGKWREPPNARGSERVFAHPEEWDWMLTLQPGGQKQPITGSERASRLLEITNTLRAHRKLRGSPLTAKQVGWAKNVSELVLMKRRAAIYADAGAGKTDTADFTLQLLRRLFGRDQPDVVWVSPFATKVDIDGIITHKLEQFSGDIVIPVMKRDTVVLVDEAHKLVPESANYADEERSRVRIILDDGKGHRDPVEWLSMTATPVVPAVSLGLQGEFFGRLYEMYRKEEQRVSQELERLSKDREAALPDLKKRTKQKKIADLSRQFEQYQNGVVPALFKQVSITLRSTTISNQFELVKHAPQKDSLAAFNKAMEFFQAPLNRVQARILSLEAEARHNSAAREALIAYKAESQKLIQSSHEILDCLAQLKKAVLTPSKDLQGPYEGDELTPQIENLEAELQFVREKAEEIRSKSCQTRAFPESVQR